MSLEVLAEEANRLVRHFTETGALLHHHPPKVGMGEKHGFRAAVYDLHPSPHGNAHEQGHRAGDTKLRVIRNRYLKHCEQITRSKSART